MRQTMAPAKAPPRATVPLGTMGWGVFLLLTLALLITLISHMADGRGALLVAASGQTTDTTNAALKLRQPGELIGTPPTVTAPFAFLYDATTGLVYYTKSADTEKPMASCTKMMTALLAVEHGKLTDMVPIKADAAAFVNPQSSYMGVSVGEQISLNDLLYGLMLPSGNDAAVAIADYVSGSVPAFATLMNQRAQELGLTHTHFITPNGFDLTPDAHYTSARDLAVLGAVAEQNPIIRQVTSTIQYTIPKTATHKAYNMVTGTDLLSGARSPYAGAIGVKPGFTGLAGFCEAFAAERDGHMMVGAVLAEPSWQVRITDMRSLLDWGFAQVGVGPSPVVPSWTKMPASAGG